MDIRLMNADRNSANLLCRIRPDDGFMELVPIDHGFCLRDVCDVSWMDWCWLDWPQMKEVCVFPCNFLYLGKAMLSNSHVRFEANVTRNKGIH